jgi:hypothetical protein
MFDRLLLVPKSGGKTVFFGDIGEDSRDLVNYFEQASEGNARCPEFQNPANFMLNVITDQYVRTY